MMNSLIMAFLYTNTVFFFSDINWKHSSWKKLTTSKYVSSDNLFPGFWEGVSIIPVSVLIF